MHCIAYFEKIYQKGKWYTIHQNKEIQKQKIIEIESDLQRPLD